MLEYLTTLLTVPTTAVTNAESYWDAELNLRASEGWAFVQAVKVNHVKYLLIFERVQ